MSGKSKICAIGEKKLIDGKWYEKAAADNGPDRCKGCSRLRGGGRCVNPCESIEDGGEECSPKFGLGFTIWIACDPPQPETPAVEECAGCRYWKKDAVTNDGVCRRYPIDQPRKYRTDWCGEWKA